MLQALVTGGGGFTGKAVVRHLLNHGVSVRAMVRNPKAAEELRALGAEPFMADLNHLDSLRAALTGVSHVFHIAALFRKAGIPSSEFHKVNVEGTRNLLDCAIEKRVEKVVHCSTVGVLGHVTDPPADEEAPYNPGDPYQESKMNGEKLFLEYARSGRISGCVIRPAMIYGPGDQRTLKLFKRIAERRFFYVGPGKCLVHFVDVRDLAEAFRLAANNQSVNGEIFIIGGETALPLKELVTWISAIFGVPKPWLHLPVQPMQMLGSLCEALCTPLRLNPPIFRRRVDFFTKDRYFDCTKARKILGFKPSKPLIEELIDIIGAYIASGDIRCSTLSKPSAILRTMSGRINAWDERARWLYGWEREQVVGEITHALLETEFPLELRLINRKLREEGLWQGALLHKNKEGRVIKVKSKWCLVSTSCDEDPLVLELNQPEEGGDTLLSLGIGAITLSNSTLELAAMAGVQ